MNVKYQTHSTKSELANDLVVAPDIIRKFLFDDSVKPLGLDRPW
jgi:hypothetical protein